MRKPQGYHVTVGPAPAVRENQYTCGRHERDTFTCGHCQAIVDVVPFADPADMGGLCRVCNRLICSKCVESPQGCVPWEKMLEKIEQKYESDRRVQEITGR